MANQSFISLNYYIFETDLRDKKYQHLVARHLDEGLVEIHTDREKNVDWLFIMGLLTN